MRFHLPNGLCVVLHSQRAAPVVAMQLWVRAGSADESEADAGLAHVHEHMLFKGTARRGPGEIAHAVENCGGVINAWTSYDETVYHLVLASRYFDEGLDVLADAARESSFDPEELQRELEVICEEIRRSDDQPSRRVSRNLMETAFKVHPYRRPILGTEASIRALTRDRILDYYHRHYVPQNMTLIAVGDFDEAHVRPLIQEQFGGAWGRSGLPPIQREPEPLQTGPRARVAMEDVREGQLTVAFHVPEVTHDDAAALDLLGLILGQGESSRLQLSVKREQMLASEVYASAFMPRDPGLFVEGAVVPPDRPAAALRAVLAEAHQLTREPVSAAELATAKAIIEADGVYQRETVQGMARKLGFFHVVAGSLEYEARYYERVAAVTAEDLMATARKYFTVDNTTVSAIVGHGGELSESSALSIIRDAATQTQATPFRYPNVTVPLPGPPRIRPSAKAVRAAASGLVRTKLANGATLVVKPEAVVPIVAMQALFRGGLLCETEADNGITALLARTVTRGAGRFSGDEISRAVDEMAGSISGQSGRNSFGLRAELLSKHLTRGFKLFADCLLRPSFPGADVEKERAVLLQEIRSRDDDPAGTAFQLFSRTLFQVHPYRFDVAGEEKSVLQLDGRNLRAYHTAYAVPAGLTLVVAGDVDPEEVLGLAEEHLGHSLAGLSRAPVVPREPDRTGPRRAFKVLDKNQSHIVLGYPGATLASKDRHALDVLSSVLSGQSGRLFIELRDKRALAYSLSAYSLEGIDPGYFAVYMATAPEKVEAAVGGIRAEVLRITSEKVGEVELSRAKRQLVGLHEIGLQRNSARAAVIAFDETYGLGAEAYREYPEHIDAVSGEDVLAVARRYLRPEVEVLAIVGPER
jgi:zinc protease